MPDVIVIRLHPAEPVGVVRDPSNPVIFQDYLNGLTITAYDFSFNQREGEEIGRASYLPNDLSNSRISQNFVFEPNPPGPPVLKLFAVATAIIEVPAGRTEYLSSDLRFKIERNGREIINRSVHYNVPFVSVGSIPQPVNPNPGFPETDPYRSLNPIALYLPLPDPGRELDSSVGYVDLPADGNPPNFAQLKAAVEQVLAADPGGSTDLTQLTPDKCKHIAYEIAWNREVEPPPAFPRSLEDFEKMYTKPEADSDEAERDRKRFEAELYSYYAIHNAKADQLSKYIYSLSAALFCEKQSREAMSVRFTFPVRLSPSVDNAKINEAEVLLSN